MYCKLSIYFYSIAQDNFKINLSMAQEKSIRKYFRVIMWLNFSYNCRSFHHERFSFPLIDKHITDVYAVCNLANYAVTLLSVLNFENDVGMGWYIMLLCWD